MVVNRILIKGFFYTINWTGYGIFNFVIYITAETLLVNK